jgi:hypothetical protein
MTANLLRAVLCMSSRYRAPFLWLALACVCCAVGVRAEVRGLALKSGETAELGLVYWVINCRSIMVGTPVLEVLEGPEEIVLAIKDGMVLPRRLNCANQVPGGTVVATVKEVKEPKQARLTYRIKYKTKDGDRQTSTTYDVSLFP